MAALGEPVQLERGETEVPEGSFPLGGGGVGGWMGRAEGGTHARTAEAQRPGVGGGH